MTAKPIFIVSSGRSGSKMMERLFAAVPGLTMEHEYCCTLIQPLGVRRYLGLAAAHEVDATLRAVYGAALHYAATPHWGDSSNKLAWLIPPLARLFPDARFVHLVRDGRKVASSYFHKLGRECYDDSATAVLQAYVDDPVHVPAPPPEKRYWWPVPRPGDPWADQFRGFNQFERIAFHWAELNRVVLRDLAALPSRRRHFVRLEDLVASPATLKDLFDFLGLPMPPGLHDVLRKPHNVNRPVDTPLTDHQLAAFRAIAWDVMETLGYADRDLYVVNY